MREIVRIQKRKFVYGYNTQRLRYSFTMALWHALFQFIPVVIIIWSLIYCFRRRQRELQQELESARRAARQNAAVTEDSWTRLRAQERKEILSAALLSGRAVKAIQGKVMAQFTTAESVTNNNEVSVTTQRSMDDACVICMAEYEDGEAIKASRRCPHVFHAVCITDWLGRSKECPCCRRDFIENNTANDNGNDNGEPSSGDGRPRRQSPTLHALGLMPTAERRVFVMSHLDIGVVFSVMGQLLWVRVQSAGPTRHLFNDPCTLCHNRYRQGDFVGLSRTHGHYFHLDCIVHHLLSDFRCPCCPTVYCDPRR